MPVLLHAIPLIIDKKILSQIAINFESKLIQNCFNTMQKKQTIDPLLDVLKKYKEYRFINSDAVSTDLIKLLYHLYWNTLQVINSNTKTVPPQYKQFNDFEEINNLFDLLDEVAITINHNLPLFYQNQSLFNKISSWLFKKNIHSNA